MRFESSFEHRARTPLDTQKKEHIQKHKSHEEGQYIDETESNDDVSFEDNGVFAARHDQERAKCGPALFSVSFSCPNAPMLTNQKGTFSVNAVIEIQTDEAQLELDIRVPSEVSKVPNAFERRAPEMDTILAPNLRKLRLEGLKTAGASYEITCEIEATLKWTETATPKDRPIPVGTIEVSVVVERHFVIWHEVKCSRPRTLISASPKPDPMDDTKMLECPTILATLTKETETSYVKVSEIVPTEIPLVTTTLDECIEPALTEHRRALSEPQAVAEQLDQETFDRLDNEKDPKPMPNISTELSPETGALTRKTPEKLGESKEKAIVTLPGKPPAVSDKMPEP